LGELGPAREGGGRKKRILMKDRSPLRGGKEQILNKKR